MDHDRNSFPTSRALGISLSSATPDLNNAAHLWIVEGNEPPDPDTASRFIGLLDAGESTRLDQFLFFEDRMRFLLSHALVRIALSQYRDVSPDAWCFAPGQNGRPEIAGPVGAASGLRFNLTHTKGLAACVVTHDMGCGVDAEFRKTMPDLQDLAATALHPRELRDFGELSKTKQLDHFLALWTAKEACLKACGRGFSMAPDTVALQIDSSGASARVLSAPENLNWHIRLYRPTPDHHLALALDPSGPTEIVAQRLQSDLVSLV
ncbi:MAG: 4'-phosphopantetheinyl transferase superfamily protein [Pseudomonadota bacterium]